MSEILLNAQDLKPVMQGLGKIVSRKSTLPVLQHVRIARENHVVTLQATDLDAWATYRTSQPGEPVQFFVPFETLNKIVKPIKGEAVITLTQDKTTARLVYLVGKSPVEVKLPSLGKDEWPAEPKVEGETVILPDTFKPALSEALLCASTDSSRYVLNGACLDVTGKDGHYVIGTNGSHLYASNSFEFSLKSSLIIPASKFIAWNSFADDGAWSLVTAKLKTVPWLKIISDRWTFTGRQIDGNYPNWRQCRPTPNSTWTRIKFPANEVESLLKNIPLLPGHDSSNGPVTIEVTGDAVLLKARAKEAKEWTAIRVEAATVTGKPVSICLNRDYLLRALRFGLLELAVLDPLTPMLFSSTGRQMVVMPVRGEAAEHYAAAKAEAKKTKAEMKPAEPARKPDPQPAPSAEPVTQERKTMPKETKTAETTETQTKTALEQIDAIKETLKAVIRDLAGLTDALKQTERERKLADKEVESVRAKLRDIQSVRI